MASRFLDGQLSQNASYANSITVAATTTPALFGTLGLDISNAGTNRTNVHFSATVTLATVLAVLGTAEITIVRNGSVLVYSGTTTTPATLLTEVSFTVSGVDFNVPTTPNFVTYQAFIAVTGIGVSVNRVGPESFQAIAYASP
ncbi:hypothetical protein [Paenibacillus sp. 481]|uniref:hypothetical protein n=1 Tax=Paenibacillus sp. 481 TaxID=2835869 RepID=UPI001E5B6DF3|nr:hypothetical protein [Paenibacillus sp. 481]UHA73041.1 hypothetical protein KIK04_20960 [Paenibacillus sp. 481]